MVKALLTPKDLADAIGTSESSMRRWIDAGKVKMTRTAGGHRRIELVEALRFVRDGGFPIVRPDILDVAPLRGLARPTGMPDADQLLAALSAGDRSVVHALLVKWFMSGRGLADIFDGPVCAAMTQLGLGWDVHPGNILTEHRATDLCIEAIHHLHSLLPPPGDVHLALGATPNDEWHSIPSLMAAAIATEAGYRGINYGANVPVDLLATATREMNAKVVWISLTMSPTRGLRASLARLAASLEERDASLVIGGQHSAEACPGKRDNVHCLASMSEFSRFLRDRRP